MSNPEALTRLVEEGIIDAVHSRLMSGKEATVYVVERAGELGAAKVYKDGVPHDKAMQIIVSERGAHFDPDVVDAFVEVQEEFAAIARRYADTDADMQQKIEYMANAIAEVAVL